MSFQLVVFWLGISLFSLTIMIVFAHLLWQFVLSVKERKKKIKPLRKSLKTTQIKTKKPAANLILKFRPLFKFTTNKKTTTFIIDLPRDHFSDSACWYSQYSLAHASGIPTTETNKKNAILLSYFGMATARDIIVLKAIITVLHTSTIKEG